MISQETLIRYELICNIPIVPLWGEIIEKHQKAKVRSHLPLCILPSAHLPTPADNYKALCIKRLDAASLVHD